MIARLTWAGSGRHYLLLTLLLTVFAVAPLAYPGYMQVHSGFIPVYNLADLASSPLHSGWTPSVATHFDPLRGDGLLPYYLALPIVWLTRSPLSGVKVLFALSFLLGAIGVYVWLRRPLGAAGASLATLVYTYLPYHLAVVYVRGSWGEAMFLGLLPWGLVAATGGSTRVTKPPIPIILTALLWGLIGLSQAGLALWGFILLVVWLIGVDRRPMSQADHKGYPYAHMAAALIGLLAVTILMLSITDFSLPASPTNFFDHFLYLAQLFSAYWGFGASRPGWDDGLALGFGFAAIGLAMLALFLLLDRVRSTLAASNQVETVRTLPVFILTLILTLLLLSPLAFVWQLSGLNYTLAYPWQLLGLIGLLLSMLAGLTIALDRRLAYLPAYAGLVILTLLASYSYLEPRFTQHPPNRPLATWDDYRLMLLDYDLSVQIPPAAAGLPEPTPRRLPLSDYGLPVPGDTLHVTLTWQAIRPFDRDLKLFLHLMDESGQMITQVDPLAGAGAGSEASGYLTSHWNPGELIEDDVAIAIPPDAPPGRYRLALGLYDGETLERLPVVGRADGQVEIEINYEESVYPSDQSAERRP